MGKGVPGLSKAGMGTSFTDAQTYLQQPIPEIKFNT